MDKTQKMQQARKAFWGGYPALDLEVYSLAGYATEDGQEWYPANGLTLREYIDTAMEIDDETFAALMELKEE